MPPKIKITEEDILNAAIEITREKGIASVNARELARLLGCSIQPIFRNFENMDKLKRDLYKRVENIFDEYMIHGEERHTNPFLGVGLLYTDFAKKEKNLFKLLFMSDEFKGRSIFEIVKNNENEKRLEMISEITELSSENIQQLFVDIWVMTHGIASMIATDYCDFTEEQIVKILMDSFCGIKYQLSIQEKKSE